MEEIEHYQQLVRRFQDNSLSEEELEVFFHLLETGRLDKYLITAMTDAGEAGTADSDWVALAEEIAAASLYSPSSIPPRRRLLRPKRIAVAAIFLLTLAGGLVLWTITHRSRPAEKTEAVATKIIPPGGNKAILTLSNGANIILDSAADGLLTRDGNIDVRKPADGELSYQRAGSTSAAPAYNTVTTPRGGIYRIVLSDGTKVWLNAASSLRFPTAFSSRDRSVTVTGEAYFDVTKDPDRPFIVSAASGLQVEVLGTDFNIMSYSDETEIRTTLIRGAVKLFKGTAEVLHPGDQALVHWSSPPAAAGEPSIHLIHHADTTAAIAWTTGFFQFEDLDIRPLMRQIARWYDVEIVYDKEFAAQPARHLGGRISRRLNLTDVLHILEANKIHFRMEGSTIHVLP